MALTDALERRTARSAPPGPKVARLLGVLDEPDRDALLAALRSQLPHAVISDALSDEGHQCSEKAVAYWRKVNGWDSQNG